MGLHSLSLKGCFICVGFEESACVSVGNNSNNGEGDSRRKGKVIGSDVQNGWQLTSHVDKWHHKEECGVGGLYSMGIPMVGEVEELWAARVELSGVVEKIKCLMTKIDMGLNLVMGLGSGLSSPPHLSSLAPIINGLKMANG